MELGLEKSFAIFDTTSWSLSIRFLVRVTSTELKYLEQLNKWTTKISFRRQIQGDNRGRNASIREV